MRTELAVQSGFANTADARLYYELAGAGEPLVLLHGFGLDRRMWDAQFEVFARSYLVVRYDLRGYGKSSLPDRQPYTHAGDLRLLLDKLGISDAHVIGMSKGGWIATNFTLNYPEYVRSLVLVGSALIGYHWSTEWSQRWDQIVETARLQGIAAAKQRWLEHPIFASACKNPSIAARLAEIFASYSGWHWVNKDLHRSIIPPDIDRLGEIRRRTLILLGERDLPDFHSIASILHEKIAASILVTLPRAGHLENMESPERFNEELIEFLRSV